MFILRLGLKSFSAASTFLSFCLLVLSLLSASTHLRRTATATLNNFAANTSNLHLNVGLNFSIAFNSSNFISSNSNSNQSSFLNINFSNSNQSSFLNLFIAGTGAPSVFREVAVAGLNPVQLGLGREIIVFLPFLSSPGFFNEYSSGFSGFSFGYLIVLDGEGKSAIIDLAVCGGLSGNLSDVIYPGWISVADGRQENHPVSMTRDGAVMPLWTANGNTRPLTSGTVSLVVVGGAAPGEGNVLQLSDHTTGTVMWSVRDAGMIEMQDSGNLVIYDTINKTKAVWQSFSQPRDALFQDLKLTASMELRSSDSAYIARMEKGGLVVYLDKVRFIERPSAYWVIPLSFPSMYSHPTISRGDLRKQLLELPCEPSYMALDWWGNLTLDLKPGKCTVGSTWTRNIISPIDSLYWLNFLRLENDGRLYWYGFDRTTTTRTAVDTYNEAVFFHWGECAAPMACGPLGVCTPFVLSPCSCPSSSGEAGTPQFELLNSTDPSKGCRLETPLPKCILGNEHVGTTSYLQMNETATVFLFGGWPFDFIASPRVDQCMKLCSANCSCTGFFYQGTNSACFLMTDAIGLLRINNQNNTSIGEVGNFLPSNGQVLASSYTTYLKINSSPAKPRRRLLITIIEALASAVALSLILGSILYLFLARKHKRNRDKARKAEDKELRDILPLLPSRFSYDDLHKATKGFTELLGAGGCGSVYAGVLLDGRKVAVKLLEAGLLKGQQSKQFLAEVATVGRTNHQNIVCLVGFCWEVYHRLLVYEYMEKGSLDQWLFAKAVDVAKSTVPVVQARSLLDWPTRYNVAIGIARGLTYLHEECLQPILHVDIKPQNILLDDAYVAKLADFGLSKLMQRGISEVVTGVIRGTPGYIAPEMQAHGAVSTKSDVYSMGMVMLEIVGGRKNIDIKLLNSACHEWYFPSWAAKKCEQGLMLELVDKRIGQAYDKEQACRLIQTAFWCIHDNVSKRPSASTVVQWLEGKCFISQPPFSIIAHIQSSVEEDIPCLSTVSSSSAPSVSYTSKLKLMSNLMYCLL